LERRISYFFYKHIIKINPKLKHCYEETNISIISNNVAEQGLDSEKDLSRKRKEKRTYEKRKERVPSFGPVQTLTSAYA
jgi:hypothetical protein